MALPGCGTAGDWDVKASAGFIAPPSEDGGEEAAAASSPLPWDPSAGGERGREAEPPLLLEQVLRDLISQGDPCWSLPDRCPHFFCWFFSSCLSLMASSLRLPQAGLFAIQGEALRRPEPALNPGTSPGSGSRDQTPLDV